MARLCDMWDSPTNVGVWFFISPAVVVWVSFN